MINNRKNPEKTVEQRKQALTDWINKVLTPDSSDNLRSLVSLGSDAGFRRYYRLHPALDLPALAVDAPPETEDTPLFIELARYFRSHGINTPNVIAADSQEGFLLVEDFGDRLLHADLTPDTANGLYGEALMTLLSIQQCTDIPQQLPVYDQAMLRRELSIFTEWFVEKLLKYIPAEPEQQMLEKVFAALEDSAMEQPQLLVHRDFHSRNLMLCTSGALGVIDFQGAVRGPFSYDLVSLLRDCYIRWPAEDVRRWALSYGNMAMDVGIIGPIDESTYLRHFDWMGLQRHIKVLGIFARLHLRDHKHHYLADLPLVIRYVLEVVQEYPELTPLGDWFKQQLLPLAQQQSWYTNYRVAGDHAA